MDLQNANGEYFTDYLQEMADRHNSDLTFEEMQYSSLATPESLIDTYGEKELIEHFLK